MTRDLTTDFVFILACQISFFLSAERDLFASNNLQDRLNDKVSLINTVKTCIKESIFPSWPYRVLL